MLSSTPSQASQQRSNANVESCGYVTFLLSNTFAILYVLWAFLPDRFIQQIGEQYGSYYPPRELAVYIPIYLVLAFFCIPIMYMGLNMLSAPKVDCVSAIWDTCSNECSEQYSLGPMKTKKEDRKLVDECTSQCECLQCEDGDYFTATGEKNGSSFSIPSICDLDVRLVNRFIYRQVNKKLD